MPDSRSAQRELEQAAVSPPVDRKPSDSRLTVDYDFTTNDFLRVSRTMSPRTGGQHPLQQPQLHGEAYRGKGRRRPLLTLSAGCQAGIVAVVTQLLCCCPAR